MGHPFVETLLEILAPDNKVNKCNVNGVSQALRVLSESTQVNWAWPERAGPWVVLSCGEDERATWQPEVLLAVGHARPGPCRAVTVSGPGLDLEMRSAGSGSEGSSLAAP